MFALLLVLAPRGLAAAEMRVRLAWGGGDEKRWSGTVSVAPEGILAQPTPLGIEADEPGSMWLERGQLVVQQRSPRAYDGVDLLINAPLDAKLLVNLTSLDGTDPPAQIEIPLDSLLAEFHESQLDTRGNRLLVRRTPDDVLRVVLPRDSLVFAPGEVCALTIQPHLLPLPAGSKVKLRASLVSAVDGQELWWSEHDVLVGQPAAIPLEVALPQVEGVYDLIFTATPKANLQQAIRQPLNWNKPTIERRVQLLVLDWQRPARPAEPSGELSQVGKDVDPINLGWQERLAKLPQPLKLPLLLKGPPSSGNMKAWHHPILGEMAQLAPNRQAADVSWEAYTLPIDQPGRPHVLEIDYPSDVPQSFGVSILEPNAAGALMPIGLDSGIDTEKRAIGGDAAPHWLRHRLVFWPRTDAPVVLVTNRRDDAPAAYGRMRVLAGWQHLPPAQTAGPQPPGQPPQSGRRLTAYLDRPLFPENFSAPESLDEWSGRSLDDWNTFYQGGRRLIEYLRYAGFDGLMLSVLADGSTIYPSRVLEPTPRYDTGVFFATAQDPVRKDVLEMLFRLFDREGLQLIPTLELAAPLPELEALRRNGGPESVGIEWVGPDGATWRQHYPIRRGLGPYYNVLQPKVQEAIARAVRELVGRYAHHESFAGLSIQLSADGYAQLLGPDWGMDDATIAMFQRQTNVHVPGTGPTRFAERASFLRGEENRRTWIEWRSGELNRFYRQLQAEVDAVRPGSRLYLAGTGALAGAGVEGDLRPALPQTASLAGMLLRIGIDPNRYRGSDKLVLLRPERIAAGGRLASRAVDLEIGQMPDVDDCFRNVAAPGSLFFHPPQQIRVASFDATSPFQPAYTWLVAQPVPSGQQNRRRFVHSLATLDSQIMVDGGWMLPLGQEESTRLLLAAYHRLPAIPFLPADATGAGKSQPVTFRYATSGGHTYVYAANDSPLATTAWVRLSTPVDAPLDELTGMRKVAPLGRDAQGTFWRVDLDPYDLVAVRLAVPGVKLSDPRVTFSPALKTALEQRISQLGVRVALLQNPPPLRVLDNPGFESPSTAGEPLPGWVTSQQDGVTVEIDKTRGRDGQQSVRMATNGPWACLVSRPFAPPETGRLWMSVWLRVADVAAQPSVQLALEGKLDGNRYYRHAPVGLAPAGGPQAAAPIGTDWTQYLFQVDDLPLEGLSQLHVRFDVRGPGEVWVDEVELYDVAFSPNERKELNKLITLASVTMEEGRVGDCLRLLEGYWPRFLEQNVPLPPGGIANRPAAPPIQVAAPPPQEPPKTGLLDRVRDILPLF